MKKILALLTLISLPAFAESVELDLTKKSDVAKIEVTGPFYTGCSGKRMQISLAGSIGEGLRVVILNPQQEAFKGFMETLKLKLSASTFKKVEDAFRPNFRLPPHFICQAEVRDSGEMFVDMNDLVRSIPSNVRFGGKLPVELPNMLNGQVQYFNQQN